MDGSLALDEQMFGDASEDNEELKEYMKKLLYQIENYDGENCIK